ncbi:MAG: BatA domain-containing protein [Mariniblastus sp.]
MFDNLFTNSPAIWTGLIGGMIALPILIHLINLMRHKTVEWAAMEFLLRSYKKNRNWVWLKQLFLLLSRIAALVLALFMLAQVGCDDDRISRLLGGATTHHYVLVDDSFSMGDRGSGGSAFDRARSTLSLIASRAKNRQNQLFTLIRYSQARPETSDISTVDGETASQIADLSSELVDNLFDQRIEDTKSRIEVSNLSVGLLGSLQSVKQLILERKNENALLYVLSDFRETDWSNPSDVDSELMEIYSTGAAVELVSCANTERPNLAITALEPAGNVRVAGTPLMMKLTIKNCSSSTVEKVQVKLESLEFETPTRSSVPEEADPAPVEIPTVFIPSISAGEAVSREFPVFFNRTGKHVVVANLPDDAVSADNRRWSVTEFKKTAKVLMVDDAEQLHSSFLSLAISPGGMTGIEPDIKTRDFLRDTTPETLSQYDVLFLLDVNSLDESAIENVESFADRGGGVVFFLGPKTNISAFNRSLYRDGEGIFPIELSQVKSIPELTDEKVPDISPNQHPMFAPVLDAKTSLLDLVQIKQIVQPTLGWDSNNSVETLASVRGNKKWPLIVQKSFGKGKVIAFTTTAGPIWNNWSRNATFPPILLLMQDYLATGKYVQEERLVGLQLEIEKPSNDFTPAITLISPNGSSRSDASRLVTRSKMKVSPTSAGLLRQTIGNRLPSETVRETDVPGLYDVWLRRTDSMSEVERFALNVDTSESEMALANRQALLAGLEKSQPTLVDWNEFNPEPQQKPTSSLSKLLLLLLVSVLIVEQVLAYSTSYHRR